METHNGITKEEMLSVIEYLLFERSQRSEYGLCYFCGEPVIEGKRVCEKHYRIPEQFLNHAPAQDHI